MREEVLQAVERLKRGEHHTTAIKVELEANLHRCTEDYDCLSRVRELLGLSGSIDEDYDHEGSSMRPNDSPIKYMLLYNDGSVDTELTFTVSLDKPENVLLLVDVVNAFTTMAEEVGSLDTSGAGMHMALLNNVNCEYPVSSPERDWNTFRNFRKSMKGLLPALYFLASPNGHSRGMNFRVPQVETEKYSAINFDCGALEFRVFDTCYSKPEQILDNVIVIANCMKYWSDKYIPTGMDKITKSFAFGSDSGRTLERLYTSTTHVDLLNAGLRKLKPEYKSIQALKKERDFKTTRRVFSQREKAAAVDAAREYKEYEERFDWSLRRQFHYYIIDHMEVNKPHTPDEMDKIEAEGRVKAQERIEHEKLGKKSLGDYVTEKVNDYKRSAQGRWPINV